MERDGFVFYKSFYEASKFLSDEEKGRLFDMICQYGLYGNEIETDGPEMGMFLLIKPQLDANNRRYENGCKGGAPEGNSNAVKTWENISKQPKNNQTTTKKQPKNNQKQPKDKDKDKDKEKEKEKEKGCGEKQDTQLSLDAFASRSEERETVGNKKVYDVGSIIHKDCETQEQREAIDEAWNAYKEMRKKIKKPLTEYAEKLRAGDLIKLGRTVDERIAILNQSTASGWQDLYELKPKQSSAVPRVSGNLLH